MQSNTIILISFSPSYWKDGQAVLNYDSLSGKEALRSGGRGNYRVPEDRHFDSLIFWCSRVGCPPRLPTAVKYHRFYMKWHFKSIILFKQYTLLYILINKICSYHCFTFHFKYLYSQKKKSNQLRIAKKMVMSQYL